MKELEISEIIDTLKTLFTGISTRSNENKCYLPNPEVTDNNMQL